MILMWFTPVSTISVRAIDTKAPALTQFYVYKNSEGNWVINNGALQDSEISAYMEKQLSDSDVSALIKKVQNELDQAQQSDSVS